jgi:hypothetical protein
VLLHRQIPKRFKLFGQTIEVVYFPEVSLLPDGVRGYANYRRNEIQLRSSSPEFPLSDEQIAETFWHELSHFILYFAGAAYSGKEDFMHQDEGFVDLVGNLLHQAVSTFEIKEG